MTTLTLEAMIAIASRTMDRAFAKFGEIHPHWYAITRGGERQLISPEPGPFTKDQKAIMVRRLLQDIDAVQVLFVDECWQVAAETEEQLAAIKAWYEDHPGLEDYPGRIEAVVFQAEDENGRMVSAWREITRKRGKAKLGPLNQYEPVTSEGRLAGWLGGRGRQH